jgi:hypothetical protein
LPVESDDVNVVAEDVGAAVAALVCGEHAE